MYWLQDSCSEKPTNQELQKIDLAKAPIHGEETSEAGQIDRPSRVPEHAATLDDWKY